MHPPPGMIAKIPKHGKKLEICSRERKKNIQESEYFLKQISGYINHIVSGGRLLWDLHQEEDHLNF